MTRAPIVLAGTALGLGGILGYHISSTPSSAVSATTSAGTASAGTATAASAGTTTAASTTTSSSSAAARSATGTDVSYMYGDLELKVTATGNKVTGVSVVRLDVTDPRSQQIDQSAVPELRQETLAAGSAKIDAVSGASYTSQAYEQSLQSALDKLGVSSAAA